MSHMQNVLFRQQSHFEKENEFTCKIHEKYSNKIPVIVKRNDRSELLNINGKGYLVDPDCTIGNFLCILRKKMMIEANSFLFFFIDKHFLPINMTFSQAYRKYKNYDGFLYINYDETKFCNSDLCDQ